VLGGILWVLRNRASWRDILARFGNSNTAYKRYRLWSDTGLWERLLSALRSGPDKDNADVSL
jgi:transposase